MLATRSEVQAPELWPEISVWSFRSPKPQRLWRMPRARWETWTVPARLDANISAESGNIDTLLRRVDGRSAVVIRRPAQNSEESLGLYLWAKGGFQRVTEASGQAPKSVSFDGCIAFGRHRRQVGLAGYFLVRAGSADPCMDLADIPNGATPDHLTGLANETAGVALVTLAGHGDQE